MEALLARYATRRAVPYRLQELLAVGRLPPAALASGVAPTLREELCVRAAQQCLRLRNALGPTATSARMMASSLEALDAATPLFERLSAGGDDGTFEEAVRALYSVDDQRASFVEIFTEELSARGSLGSDDAEELRLRHIMLAHLGASLLLQHFLAVARQRGVDRRGRRKSEGVESAAVGALEPLGQVPDLVDTAVQQAMHLCEAADAAPSIRVITAEGFAEAVADATASPLWTPGSYLYHGLLELLKNALAATIESHGDGEVRAIISASTESVCVLVEDDAGGLEPAARAAAPRWTRSRSGAPTLTLSRALP
mmetsp:Transcript_10879/g.33094  ORF Transcript_10879/g.33094 Transcript_10879/m.33094 type:complete len:313 (-) Transcript_10879:448-1386(-)